LGGSTVEDTAIEGGVGDQGLYKEKRKKTIWGRTKSPNTFMENVGCAFFREEKSSKKKAGRQKGTLEKKRTEQH